MCWSDAFSYSSLETSFAADCGLIEVHLLHIVVFVSLWKVNVGGEAVAEQVKVKNYFNF